MRSNGEIIRGIITLLVIAGGGLAFIVWTIVRAEDPARRLVKWILTAPILALLIWKVAPIVGGGGYAAAFTGMPLTAVCGLALAIIWRYDLGALVARPFTALYDGGSVPPEPQPLYSIAQSKQKKGLYLEAIAEVRKQLDLFPTDLEGQMLLAQIQAENLKDLPAAELTIQRLCAQPGHAPRNLVFALYSMADWHLQFGQDPDAARRHLQQIIERLPDSEFALGAAHRIAHLADAGTLAAAHEPVRVAVPHREQHIGLLKDPPHLSPPEKSPGEQAAEYVKHLEQHPLDTEAREQLAILYADHYHRLDLAQDQLEQIISQPHQPPRLVARWLNLLADLQIRSGATYDEAKETVERIINLYPTLPAADIARNRLDRLKLEVKAREKSQAVKLGSYEQNIGLKRGLPRQL